jgi:monovalent cation:H+ antiporter, CPA1 family
VNLTILQMLAVAVAGGTDAGGSGATGSYSAAGSLAAASASADTGETTLGLIRLFVLLVGVTALVTIAARRANLPYTLALVAFGIAAGAIFTPLQVQITPELVLVVLLPGLIFEASYQIDFEKLRPSLLGVSLLAGPGVLVSAGLVALFLNVGAGLAPTEAFIVGAMLAATDPAAVIATFKRLASPRRLATLIESESLFNDGTGIVAFTLAVGLVTTSTAPLGIGMSFVSVVAVSAVIGASAGWVISRILPNVGDHLIEICLSVVLAYGTYLAADALHQSGVIATAVAGIVLGNYGRRLGLSARTEEALDVVWEFVAFLATAFVFLVVGFAIPLRSLADAVVPIAWAVAAVFAGRAIIVYGFLGGLRLWRRRRGRERRRSPAAATGAATPAPVVVERRKRDRQDEGDMPAGWLHVIYWSGLRGAVSTALALSLPADMPNRALLQEITFGVVLFTLVVQATTAELVVARWGEKPAREPKAKAKVGSKSKARQAAGAAVADDAAIEPAASTRPAIEQGTEPVIDQSLRARSELDGETSPAARVSAARPPDPAPGKTAQ